MIEESSVWNFKSVSDDSSFYINGDGKLVIVFNKDDVTPVSMGVPEFIIPTEALSSIALDGYFQ